MLEDTHPLDVLRWAYEEHQTGLVVTASFADAVLVDLVARAIPTADVVLLDTGYLFAETLWYAERLQERYDLRLQVIHPQPDVGRDGWLTDTDACCAARKVEPLQRALGGRTGWVTGLRRVEAPSRANTPIAHEDLLRGIWKFNPLAAWTDQDMADYTAERGLLEHPLVAHGYPSIGCWPCTAPVRPGDDPRSGRWAGSDKTECGLHLDSNPTEVPVR